MSRLDVYLTENAAAKSRERAKVIIKSGKVTVNGNVCTKPAFEVGDDDIVVSQPDDLAYVGRGGLKLAKAFDAFGLDVQGLVCADIGASTGGFTQCLLEHGAKTVYAVDVGHGQLDRTLLDDSRVVNCEGVNARELTKDMFSQQIRFISVDVSFISLSLVLPVVREIIESGALGVCLIKPQFEAGREKVGKKGVVRDKEVHAEVIEKICDFCINNGFSVLDLDYSPIKGPEGNIEYLVLIKKSDNTYIDEPVDIENTVELSHEKL